MTNHFGRRPSHTTVVAYLALVLALGGAGAYAASSIGPTDIKRNAVRAGHIKPGQVMRSDLARGAVNSSKLDLVKFDQRSSEVDVTGAGSQPLGPRITLRVPAGATVIFEAKANIAKSANTVDCRLEVSNSSFSEFLFQPDVGAGNPPEPFGSRLVPSHPNAGRRTFELDATLNGVTTETCSFDHIEFYGFALG